MRKRFSPTVTRKSGVVELINTGEEPNARTNQRLSPVVSCEKAFHIHNPIGKGERTLGLPNQAALGLVANTRSNSSFTSLKC